MSETIVLPRSGVELTPGKYGIAKGMIGNVISLSLDMAARPNQARFGDIYYHVATRDECIAWLDSRVLALRAALMPADARERVARALHAWSMKHGEADDFVLFENDSRGWLDMADAVLAALGGGK